MSNIKLDDKSFTSYISEEKINEVVNRVAALINADYKDKNPLFLVVLNGAFMFAADVLRGITTECQVSFVKLSSYTGISSSGKVKELVGMNEDLEDRHVVVLEDIVDSGTTIEYILADLATKKTASIAVATFLFKPDVYKKDFKIQYIGLEIPNHFIVGYGLDYNGFGRNLKDIYVVKSND